MGTIPIPSTDTADTCKFGVSIDTSIQYRLFMVSVYALKPRENLNKSEEKAEKCEFFKVKSSIVFQIEFSTVVQNYFGNDILCHNKTVLDGLNFLVSVSKFGTDTTRNPWYRIDLKKVV